MSISRYTSKACVCIAHNKYILCCSDDVVDWCVEIIKFSVALGLDILTKYPWIWQIGVAGFGLVAVTALIALLKAGQSRPTKDTKKEKKSK